MKPDNTKPESDDQETIPEPLDDEAAISWDEFVDAVIGLDSQSATVMLNMTLGDDDESGEAMFDCDLEMPDGRVVVSGSFQTDSDGIITSFDDVAISDEDCDYYDEEMVYARLLRRFQGENVFVPRNSPSMFF